MILKVMLKTMNKKTTATIWSFEWRTGDLKPQKIKIEKFPKDILVVDGWFSPTIGELCLNSENKLDVVKDIEYIHPKDPFRDIIYITYKVEKNAQKVWLYEYV